MFQLPREHDDLTALVKERLYGNKKLVKSAITKLYPISQIDNFSVARDTNIFLVNLYLLVLQEKGDFSEIEEITAFDNSLLLKKIEDKTNLNVSSVSIEETETLVLNHLYQDGETSPDYDTRDTEDTEGTKDTENDSEILQNIEYSLDWLKKAHRKLK